MADTKISGLSAGAPAQATDLIPIARSGANYSITPANILAYGSSPVAGTTGTFTGGVDKLTSATGVVSVAASAAPTTGQVLTATSGTVATWQTPSTTNLASPGPIGGTTPGSGAFTTLSASGATTLSSTLAAGNTTITGTLSTTSYVGIGTTTPTTFGAFVVRLGVSNFYGRTVSGAFSDAANSTLEIGHAANAVFLDTESSGVALKVQQNGTVITTTSSTGLAVTGVLSATGVVTFSNYGAGTATFSGAGVISSVSDETWKIKDGIPTDPDAMLKKLEPGYWYYNDEKKETFGTDRQLGFYAQNVNAAIGPEAAPIPESIVTKNEDGTETTTTKPWGYYDRSVLAVTVMSLQKALATIETLAAKVAKLEAA